MVGPDFRAPLIAKTDTYTADALPKKTLEVPVAGGAAQIFASGKDIPAQWWTLFKSSELDALVKDALAKNPSLEQAQAALREANENYRARVGTEYLPSVDAHGSMSRQQGSSAAAGAEGVTSVFNLKNASVSFSYVFDVFGGGRREIEALRAQTRFRVYQKEAVALSLTANVVTAAISEASLRAQINAMREIIASQQKQLDLLEKQLTLGGVSRADVLALRAQVEQTKAVLPALDQSLSMVRHALAVLTGRLPNEAALLPTFDLLKFTLPVEIPVSLPSQLVRQRPDVLSAEEMLHAASAKVGVATANLYPQFSLSGEYGVMANTTDSLLKGNDLIWSLGAGALQPVFRGGALRAQRRASIAAYDQSAAMFRQTVLTAFQNVADALRALETDAQSLAAHATAEASAKESLAITEKQYKEGAVNYVALLTAQRQYQQVLIDRIKAQAARYADTAALFQALGGGWWNGNASEGVK
jgi:NodT family efflux transporter outer membrane factor (OMF) lipoprotein